MRLFFLFEAINVTILGFFRCDQKKAIDEIIKIIQQNNSETQEENLKHSNSRQ